MKSTLVVALDVPDRQNALALAGRLKGLPVWMKIGLELFTAEGPEVVLAVQEMGFPVFLDLKFHDIPNTVYGAIKSASRLGVRLITIHATGRDMLEAAIKGRDEVALDLRLEHTPRILGVTMLTSATHNKSQAEIRERVVKTSIKAREWGIDGVVCSGLEVEAVKEACGKEFLCLAPGIRMPGGTRDDQARVCGPADAVLAGADFLVMGRPIIRAADPAAAALAVLGVMKAAKC